MTDSFNGVTVHSMGTELEVGSVLPRVSTAHQIDTRQEGLLQEPGDSLSLYLPLTPALCPEVPTGSRDRGLRLHRGRDWQPCVQPKPSHQGMPRGWGPWSLAPSVFSSDPCMPCEFNRPEDWTT